MKTRFTNGIKLDIKALSLILANILVFYLFWDSLLSQNSLRFPLFTFSVILIFALRNLLLANVAIFSGLSLAIFLLVIPPIYEIFNGKSSHYILWLLAGTLLVSIWIFRKVRTKIEVLTPKENLVSLAFACALILKGKFFFDLISSQSIEKALLYLKFTGEDNSAWLSGLGNGYQGDGNFIYSRGSDSGGQTTVGVINVLFRFLLTQDRIAYKLTENIFILQRLYFILFVLSIFFVSLATINFLKRAQISIPAQLLIAAFSGFVVYLSFVSFAVFSHLTPIESATFTFALYALISLVKPNTLKHPDYYYIFIPVISLLLAVANAWYPIAPAIYLVLGLILLYFLSGLRITKNIFVRLFFTLLVCLGMLAFNSRITYLYKSKFSELSFQVRVPGGTMEPTDIQILIFLLTTLAIWMISNSKEIDSQALKLIKILTISFLVYYLLIYVMSIATGTHTVEYAGKKLGLFVCTLILPISISLFSLLVHKKSQSPKAIYALVVVFLIVLVKMGPPTSPPSPAWTQMGFPSDAINRSNQENVLWEKALIEKIDSSPGKRVLCFLNDQELIEPQAVVMCSRFAAGIQGFEREDFLEFWKQINWNAASIPELENRKPEDFDSNYEFLLLDNLLPAGNGTQLNAVSEVIMPKIK